MTSLSGAEFRAIQVLPQDTPYMITGVSKGFFSIARHSGGITYNGRFYVYNPATDELIRDDVLKLVESLRKLKVKVERAANKEKQQDLI